MFFQDFFTKLDLTAVSAAASLLLLLSLLAFVITKARHLFRQNHEPQHGCLKITQTRTEFSFGSVRLVRVCKSATLPLKGLPAVSTAPDHRRGKHPQCDEG